MLKKGKTFVPSIHTPIYIHTCIILYHIISILFNSQIVTKKKKNENKKKI